MSEVTLNEATTFTRAVFLVSLQTRCCVKCTVGCVLIKLMSQLKHYNRKL